MKELFIYFYWFIIFFNQKSKIYSVCSKTCFDISTIISYEFVYGCDSQADCRTRALCDGQVFRSVEGFCDLWKCFLFYNFFGLFDLICLFICLFFVFLFGVFCCLLHQIWSRCFWVLWFVATLAPVAVSQWYVYPRDMCIPRGDTQNTDTRLGIQWTKWRLGYEVPTSAVKSRRNQKWIRAQQSRFGFLEFRWVPTDSIVYLTKTSNSGYGYH